MKVSTENNNNFGYEKITIVVDNIPLNILWKSLMLQPKRKDNRAYTQAIVIILRKFRKTQA
jgi:hypothetical protein